MQTANIKVNVKKANQFMFYFKDSHDAYLTLAKGAPTIAQRVKHAEKARLCRTYYKNASEFAA
ncbi:unknown [Pasteurella phage F108]|uniref:Uncharacterized protein n=1 Tax=Pasteurella phage F108 TaxID=2911430 RepID=Q1I111_9CAUD|nr:hypothetical protein F108p09 [Pasteurella phage F108]AAZ93645.1 unknown [Pasteurella phage F108]